MAGFDAEAVTNLVESLNSHVGEGLSTSGGSLHIDTLTLESDGTVRGGIAELTAKGHAEQFSTTGKNLLPMTLAGIKAANTGGTWNDNVYTIYNCTFSVVTDGNGAITGIVANGTASGGNAELNLVANNTFFPRAGTYTLSGGATSSARIFYYDGTSYYTTNPNSRTFSLTGSESGSRCRCSIPKGNVASNDVLYPQLELGSTATEYEPYTGGAPSPSPDYPQEIQVVRGHEVTGKTGRFVNMEVQGRNLLDVSTAEIGKAWNGSSNSARARIIVPVESGKTYTLSIADTNGIDSVYCNTSDNVPASSAGPSFMSKTTFVSQGAYLIVGFNKTAITQSDIDKCGIQLELGSQATGYQPYYHETRAIPLPSRGWVAGLPDGTADSLRLNGAGKVEWEESTEEVVFDGSSDEIWQTQNNGKRVRIPMMDAKNTASNGDISNVLSSHFKRVSPSNTWAGVQGISLPSTTLNGEIHISDGTGSMTVESWKTWLSTHPVTVLYPLATPVTEHAGYVDMPEIPSDAMVTIPELDDLGIRYFLDDTVTQYGREIIARVKSEYEDRLTALEQAVAELATS